MAMRPSDTKEAKFLIVDGYNMIGAWAHLTELASDDIDAARDALSETLLDYAGYIDTTLILVFDAYASKEAEKVRSLSPEGGHTLVFTRYGQTADQYIERLVRITEGELTVASSDGLLQIMVFAHASRLSARELWLAIEDSKKAQTQFYKKDGKEKTGLRALLSPEAEEALEAIRRGEVETTSPDDLAATDAVAAKPDSAVEGTQRKKRKRRRNNKNTSISQPKQSDSGQKQQGCTNGQEKTREASPHATSKNRRRRKKKKNDVSDASQNTKHNGTQRTHGAVNAPPKETKVHDNAKTKNEGKAGRGTDTSQRRKGETRSDNASRNRNR